MFIKSLFIFSESCSSIQSQRHNAFYKFSAIKKKHKLKWTYSLYTGHIENEHNYRTMIGKNILKWGQHESRVLPLSVAKS